MIYGNPLRRLWLCRLIFAGSKKLHLSAFMYFTKKCFHIEVFKLFSSKFSAYSFMSKDFWVKYSISFFSIKMISLLKSNFTNAFGVHRSLVLLFEESSWNLQNFAKINILELLIYLEFFVLKSVNIFVSENLERTSYFLLKNKISKVQVIKPYYICMLFPNFVYLMQKPQFYCKNARFSLNRQLPITHPACGVVVTSRLGLI